MQPLLTVLLVVILATAAGFLWWRRFEFPCPWWLSILVENPFMEMVAGSRMVFSRIKLRPGMKILDAGCGPGRMTIPAARIVGEAGEVTALDIQEKMLDRVSRKAREARLGNIRTIHGGVGEGLLEKNAFDRVILVTVLGEIHDREAAMDEIYQTLKPGGLLSVSELLLDPHYKNRKTVRALAVRAGLREKGEFGNALAFTLNFEKPASSAG